MISSPQLSVSGLYIAHPGPSPPGRRINCSSRWRSSAAQIGKSWALGSASAGSNGAAPIAPTKPAIPPPIESNMLAVSASLTIRRGVAPRASRTAVCPRRPTPRTSSRFATLAHAISSTKPHTDSRICRLPVLLLHHRHSRTGGHHVQHLLGKQADYVGQPRIGVSGVGLHPLPPDSG